MVSVDNVRQPIRHTPERTLLMDLAKPPEVLKKFARICKIAQDNEDIDPVITYYCRLYVASMGLKPEYKNKESREFIAKLLDYLAAAKEANAGDPLYTEEQVGLEYIEKLALDKFTEAFKNDEAGNFGPATISGFLISANLLEVLTLNGETSDELANARKYAKYKAVYLLDCKKRGKTPIAGPLTEGGASVAPNIAGLHDDPLPPKSMQTQSGSELAKPTVGGSTPNESSKSEQLQEEICEKAAKAAKFAISSLQYKDRDAAVKYLREALNLLSEH